MVLAKMKEARYGSRKQQKMSLKEIFGKSFALAKEDHGIHRSAIAWQKKFRRMKQDYCAYISKISQSDHDGDDAGPHDKPDFFCQLHELKQNKARNFPLAVLSTINTMVTTDLELMRILRRVNLSKHSFLEIYIEDQKDRHEALLPEIK